LLITDLLGLGVQAIIDLVRAAAIGRSYRNDRGSAAERVRRNPHERPQPLPMTCAPRRGRL